MGLFLSLASGPSLLLLCKQLSGVGVSTNARDGASAKYSTSTTINRCNGERGQHNYQPNYSSSEPDYSSNEMLYGALYETLYEALYKTSDHGSSPPARHSAPSLREDSEYSSGEVEPVRMRTSVIWTRDQPNTTHIPHLDRYDVRHMCSVVSRFCPSRGNNDTSG